MEIKPSELRRGRCYEADVKLLARWASVMHCTLLTAIVPTQAKMMRTEPIDTYCVIAPSKNNKHIIRAGVPEIRSDILLTHALLRSPRNLQR
jgi:hypothetical protein